MANVIHRTTLEQKFSVSTPNFPPGLWIINPNLSSVNGVPKKYWKISGDNVLEMTQAEKDVVDAAEQTAFIASLSAHTAKNPASHDVIVDKSGKGNYTTIAKAFSDGHKNVFVRRGIYVETEDIVLPEDGTLIGEGIGLVKIVFSGPYSIRIDGTGRKETAGTVTFTNASSTVTGVGTTFTNLQGDDWIRRGPTAYQILSIESNTSMTLKVPYRGKTISGEALLAMSMVEGVHVQDLVMINSTQAPALLLRQATHVTARSCLILNCGAVGKGAVDLKDCHAVLMFGVLVDSAVGQGGVFIDSTSVRLETWESKNCAEDGVYIGGASHGIVIDAFFSILNGGHGVNVNDTSTHTNLTDGMCVGNAGKGINTMPGTGTTILNSCTITDNGSDGIDFDGKDNLAGSCIIKNNGGHGVQGGDKTIITGNRISNNTLKGVNHNNDDSCSITGNIVHDNGSTGIRAGKDNTVSSNIVYANGSGGIEVANSKDNVSITTNRVYNNTGDEIALRTGSTGCIVIANNVDKTSVVNEGTQNTVVANKD